MELFQKLELEDGVVGFHFQFKNDEYLAVFDKPGYPHFVQMQWRQRGEKEFSVVNERVWGFAISQILGLVQALDPLEIDRTGLDLIMALGNQETDSSEEGSED